MPLPLQFFCGRHMFNVRHHERYDILQAPTKYPVTTMPRVRATSFARRLRLMVIVLLGSFSSQALASPFVERITPRSQVLARDGNNKGGLQVWVRVTYRGGMRHRISLCI